MRIQALTNHYQVRKLNESDIDIIYELCSHNHLFYQYHPPFVTHQSIIDDMMALPPNKTIDDKYYLGFFDNQNLIAIMDLIIDYPKHNDAFIGFFMVDILYQHQGIGSLIINELCQNLKKFGYHKIGLGVDKENPQSNAFWHKQRFQKIRETNDYYYLELPL